MIFHKLEVKNIASFRGHHSLSFEDINSEYKLFAITGETGSGKSTLLNAISLALYGQNFKGQITQTDLVTLGEVSGEVFLTFSVSAKMYVAHWSAKVRKANGELLKAPRLNRMLYSKNGDELNPLDKKVEDILGLSFDQFCKTIVLNQGQFAKFLSSSFSERKNILERLYQGDLLERISPFLKSKINELNLQKENLSSKAEGLAEQTGQNIEELKDESSTIKEKLSFFKHDLKLKEKGHNLFQEVSSFISQHQTNQQRMANSKDELSKLTKDINSEKENLTSLEETKEKEQAHFKTIKPVLLEAQEKEKKIEYLKSQIEQKSETLKRYSLKEAELKDEMLKGQKLLEEGKLELEKIQTSFTYLNERFDDKEKLSYSLIQLEASLNENEKNTIALKHLKKSFESEQSLLKQKKSELLEIENKIKLLDNKDDEKALKSGQEKREILLTQKQLLAGQKLEQTKSLKKKENLEIELKKEEKLLLKINKEIEDQQKQLKIINDAISYHKLKIAIEEISIASLKEKKCLICKSEDLSNIEQSIQEHKSNYQADLEKVKTLLNHLEQEKTHKDVMIKHIKEQLKALDSSLSQNLEEQQKNPYHSDEEYLEAIKKIDLQIKEAELKKESFIRLNQQQTSAQNSLQSLKENTDRLQSETKVLLKNETYHKEIIENNKKDICTLLKRESFEIKELKEDMTRFENSSNLKEIIKEKEKLVLNRQGRLKDAHVHINDIKEQIQESKDALEKDDAFIKSLKLATSAKEELELLENKQDKLNRNIELKKEQIKAFQVKEAGLTFSITNAKDQIKDIELKFLEHRSQIKEALNKCHTASEHLRLTEKIEQMQIVFFHDNHILSELSSHIENLYLTIKEKVHNFELAHQKVKTLIEQKEKIQSHIKEIDEEVSKLNKLLTPKLNLYELVGKDAFRNYVLCLIERDLIHYANIELTKLCQGRYELRQIVRSKKHAPDFFVIDRYNGALERKISTLSGGETFMVSLAMALALAEMTRGEGEVDSLFIDEGFGTLDSDSLDDVLQMLMQLNMRGKFVGIISHVKELTQRIGANIHMNKDTSGNSNIKIIYN